MTTKLDMNDIGEALAIIDNDKCQYQIRPMHKTDIDIVNAIERATWNDLAWPYQHMLESLFDPDYNCWILENANNTTDDPVLGYGFQYINDETKTTSTVAKICIHPNHRGYGLGDILLRHMIDHARKMAVLNMELQVKVSNKHAFMLYVKHGFKIVRRLREYYSDNSDAFLMQLSFNGLY